MTDPLRDDLNLLADDVRPVDLVHRVRTGSRRLALRRAALTATAAVLVIAAAATSAIGLTDSADTTVSADHDALPDDPDIARLLNPPITPVTELSGAVYHLDSDDRLLSWYPATGQTTVVSTTSGDTAVSPDGRYTARVTEDGRVIVGELSDPTDAGTVVADSVDSSCGSPQWIPGSDAMLVKTDKGWQEISMGGDTRPITSQARCINATARAVDGYLIGYLGDDERNQPSIRVVHSSGQVVASIPAGLVDGYWVTNLVSMSPTGRHLCVNLAEAASDGPGTCDAVIDTWTSTVAVHPEDGFTALSVFPDDDHLLTWQRIAGQDRPGWDLVDVDGRVVATGPAGPDPAGFRPLRYVP
ncbi:hypothetical protein ACFQ3B_09320 [Stackebrandtia endophytica]|uniref:hypothetical protein n=1 Tax=Stackebrandtia endophytica TaxID=1496996 RepID=UPI001153D3E2|nr:hypothetical protein [Stackebrandtia endophytica]